MSEVDLLKTLKKQTSTIVVSVVSGAILTVTGVIVTIMINNAVLKEQQNQIIREQIEIKDDVKILKNSFSDMSTRIAVVESKQERRINRNRQ